MQLAKFTHLKDFTKCYVQGKTFRVFQGWSAPTNVGIKRLMTKAIVITRLEEEQPRIILRALGDCAILVSWVRVGEFLC